MQGTVTLLFSEPSEAPEAVFADLVAELAKRAAITDLDALAEALIRGLADAKTYEAGGGMVRLPDGRYGPVAGGTFEAGQEIAELVALLDAKLTSAEFPIGKCPEATGLSQALVAYERYLGAIRWSTKGSRSAKKPRRPAVALALHLARAWPTLTGTKPTASRKGGLPTGAFYLFLVNACQAFGLEPLSVDVVRGELRRMDFIGHEKA